MKPIGIVTDSHSGISLKRTEELGIMVLPMPFYIDGECFYENLTISREDFFEKLNAKAEVNTSQPSLGDVMHKAKKAMLEAIKNDLETSFHEQYKKGEIYLLAAGSATKEATDEWLQEIKEAFPDLEVMYDDLTLGLCCHIGSGGLGIGLSCKPKRMTK